jgi:hypothetical protein
VPSPLSEACHSHVSTRLLYLGNEQIAQEDTAESGSGRGNERIFIAGIGIGNNGEG